MRRGRRAVPIGPDNGVFTGCIHALGPPTVHTLAEAKFWRPTVSATFHGRDVFAPVAAHLSLGVRPADLGPAVESWVELTRRPAVCEPHHCRGEVQFVDDFGNLITNVPAGAVTSLPVRAAVGGGDPHPVRWVRTYSDAAAGKLVCLFSSDGWFEVAVVNGSAAGRLGADVGTPVELHFE